jgi:hypothetical protein
MKEKFIDGVLQEAVIMIQPIADVKNELAV